MGKPLGEERRSAKSEGEGVPVAVETVAFRCSQLDHHWVTALEAKRILKSGVFWVQL